MRANLIFAIGATGSKKDLATFMELIRADLDHRAEEIARDIMGGHVQILPQEEVIESEESSRSSG